MSAEDSLKAGHLDEALQELQARVRREPADAKARIFLFQLLAVLGQWNRALTQLNVAGELDAGALAMVHTYRPALHSEALRAPVFGGQRSPLWLGEAEPWMAQLLQALTLELQGHAAQAAELRALAFEAIPATAGTIDGVPFEWIADADARLGPCLEVVINGRYYWLPLHRVSAMTLEAPTDLRDLIWAPAHLILQNGGEAHALIPVRYPGSEASGDSAIRLARCTHWQQAADGQDIGLGQRLLATDQGEYPLLEIRELRLNSAAV